MSLALHQLGANVSHCFRWETDQSCNQLPHSLFPTTHMGAVEDFDIEQLAAIIQDIPNHERHIILFTGGPPCKDYSNIKQHQPGRAGSQGSLFDTALSIRDDIQNRWPHQSLTLLENVVPHPEVRDDFDQLSHSMGLRPVLIDAADGQIISRPRIWWASVDWESLPATLSRHTPWQLSLDTQLFPPVLFNPIAAELQPDCHIRDFDPPSVLTHGQLFHCLTTQASTDEGRPPPRSQQLPDDTWQRWQADHRQFAPWQYQPKYLVRKHGHDWQVATPEHREAMMGFPRGWTGPHNTDRTRNTMLGNSWHVPTAMWILFLLLLQPAFGIPPPTQRVRRGSLGTMVDLWLHNPRPWGPPPRASETLHMPQNDWQDHLTWAQHHATSLQQPQHCDPTILWAIAMQRTIPQLPQLQHNVLFRKVIGLTGTILTRTDPSGTLRQRFHEHVCRVSGAQFLTRLGYNKETVQLVGRWGSEAVARYIQESNLDRPPMAHSQKELQHQIEDVVKRHIAVLHNTFWVVNTDSNKAHLPATDEDCINSAMWTTQCGWRYATGRYKKIRTKPTNNLCGSCFKFATQADLDELSDLGD